MIRSSNQCLEISGHVQTRGTWPIPPRVLVVIVNRAGRFGGFNI